MVGYQASDAAAMAAYPAVLGALALILVYLGSIAPTGSWGIVAAAGLLLAGYVIRRLAG